MKVTLLHYAGPPTAGGVEVTLEHHARLLARHGHSVQIVAGEGRQTQPDVPFLCLPDLYSKSPAVLAVKAELDRGEVSPRFDALRGRLRTQLSESLAGSDVLMAHNVCTLHKNLALTAALHDLQSGGRLPRVLAWNHDFAWALPGYRADLHPGYPWDLLRRPWPGVVNVVVSEARREELTELFGVGRESVRVVPPGVDPESFGRWTEWTREIVRRFGLLEAEAVFLLPARLTRRKNVELAIQILGAVRREEGLDARLLVTGPPGPHNPANAVYLSGLQSLRRDLGLESSVHFLYELGRPVDDDTLADLYDVADALLFPSRSEGFGIPVLEAGLLRLPVFCSDIPPFRESAGAWGHYFPLDADPEEVARDISAVLRQSPTFNLRRRVLGRYTWDRIYRERIEPLLESPSRRA